MRTETLIIGAGQAGLALSRLLTDAGHDHVVLERGRIAERWRSERPDGFRLLTPNWLTRLPGHTYTGPNPDGFMNRDQVVGFFDAYAASFDPPVHTAVTVSRVTRAGDGDWLVVTDRGTWTAATVVVATGHMDRPAVPFLAGDLPGHVVQVHSSRYRRPTQLPAGRVLVVGAGPSGQQIGDELARSGREVVLAAGGHRSLPRRYRGRDVYWWMDRLGLLDRTVDSLPDPASAVRTTRSSVLEGGHDDLDLRRLHRHGAWVTGRLLGVDGTRLRFGGALAADLAAADANATRLRTMVDDHVARTGLSVPVEPWTPPTVPDWAVTAPTALDLVAQGITAVVWATGYTRDWSWIDARVHDAHGDIVHRRGVTAEPGLYVLGLRWLHRRDSGFISGVGRDAEYLAQHLVRRPVPVGA